MKGDLRKLRNYDLYVSKRMPRLPYTSVYGVGMGRRKSVFAAEIQKNQISIENSQFPIQLEHC